MTYRAIDLFCGAGGSSCGARLAGIEIVAGFDKWGLAGETYRDNFPSAKFFEGSLEDQDPRFLAKTLGQIDIIVASPECTNHSPAKGKGPRCERSKETAFQVTRFTEHFKPRWVIIENVVSMRRWLRYDDFLNELRGQGYHVTEQSLNSASFGVPQSRRRLFLLCDRERKPSKINVPSGVASEAASQILEPIGAYKHTCLKKPGRAEATLRRATRAIETIGLGKPFLLVYYGSDHAGGWQQLNRPLRTITTLDRFALVRPTATGHVMRMLQVPELKRAMGMPEEMRFERGSRRDRIRMLGNGVCPPVMRRVIDSLMNSPS
ncbi:MAG: Modification methylase HaeIII [Phycisphaerales bacterium]|nr:Modification methylase HaeIII [Phycisphaerales bacterium]